MRILAIDDSEQALELLTDTIAEVQPSAEIFPFNKPSELLTFAKDNPCDIAFLDIKMWGMNGIAVAKKLKDYNPRINIIFVTAYTEYAIEALGLYPSGYILKAVTKEAVAREIENLRYPVELKSNARVYAQAFGNFEIYSHGKTLKFAYKKTKELLAYLIDRDGAEIDTSELISVLWENKPNTDNLKSYLRNLFSDLIKTLNEAGIADIISKRHNSIAVIPERIICDSYGFMKGDPSCVNAYAGQYMAQYSWAEMTIGKFNESRVK
ncbi:MAG: response regulator [Oscillospiraceae bacterium]|nr:response regulator [Oscillospiraceae bacterium]